MGREANCKCEHGGEALEVKAVLEFRELILRGAMSRRFPFVTIKHVEVRGERLCFECEGEPWSLRLGSAQAEQWARKILAPPATLAKRMGITAEVAVELAGEVDDRALEDALAEAKSVTKRGGALIVARIDTPEALARALKAKAEPLSSGVPMWVVYRKGRGQPLGEHDVRELCLAAGLVDHKVTAVSETLTALRFVKRR